MPLPTHLIGKLCREYIRVSEDVEPVRCAITLAWLYSGGIGQMLEDPWDTVAKLQWLFKAIELGSYSAIRAIVEDKSSVEVVEEFGPILINLRHSSFESPEINKAKLLDELKDYTLMPSIDAANVLAWLGGDIDVDKLSKRLDMEQNGRSESDDEDVIDDADYLRLFTRNRKADLEIVDSDAFDMRYVQTADIDRSVYNNILEDFLRLAEEEGLEPEGTRVQFFMSAAIYHGSLDIARFLVYRYGVQPNDLWKDLSHIHESILFSRIPIVKFFLEHGAIIEEATGNTPSGLHLANRHDNPELLTILCEHLKLQGNLAPVLVSKTSKGPIEGWTPLHTALSCRTWENVELLLQYGADPDDLAAGDEIKPVNLAVRPLSPAAPLSILKTLINKGADVNHSETYLDSPLRWAIECSNVLGVFHLILGGAVVPDAAIISAEENVEENATGNVLPVLDEDGQNCEDGWACMCGATVLIVTLLHIGQKRESGWEERLDEAVCMASSDWKYKMWVYNVIPSTHLIQVQIPV